MDTAKNQGENESVSYTRNTYHSTETFTPQAINAPAFQNSSPLNSRAASLKSEDSGNSRASIETFTRPKIDIPQNDIDDFMWDWSSRPEVAPPCEYENRFNRRNSYKPHTVPDECSDHSYFKGYSFSKLLVSHACTCILGAVLVFVCFKRYSITSFLGL
ncbi:hypothetical protein EB796_021647 [Bugula neritina]|uniref:Uncharacterized protein n=1 Tax=Bugula neritina TaxID=10212 RepID=A0A7J7J2Z9_BUGNE|nr:hypothetical protein EB796_021647 [Bugula neritina]